jgi:uncharacterized protein YxeA
MCTVTGKHSDARVIEYWNACFTPGGTKRLVKRQATESKTSEKQNYVAHKLELKGRRIENWQSVSVKSLAL